jgi:pantothenate kinase
MTTALFASTRNFARPALTTQGAAFTFNLPSYTSFLTLLRAPLTPSTPPIPFPTFDHALKDPLPSPDPVQPRHRIIIIEGLYTMLDRPGWRECAEMMDFRVFVECDEDVCRRRVVRRNWEAGVVSDLKECEARGELLSLLERLMDERGAEDCDV